PEPRHPRRRPRRSGPGRRALRARARSAAGPAGRGRGALPPRPAVRVDGRQAERHRAAPQGERSAPERTVGEAKRGVPADAAVTGSGGSGELRAGDPLGAERIGAYLARQRQLRGISPEELASQMRIPLRSLQRLEAGAFDSEPDGFARGFVRTVAIALGLPPDETLARMRPEAAWDDDGAAAGALARGLRAVAVAALLGALLASGWMWLASGAGRALAPTF